MRKALWMHDEKIPLIRLTRKALRNPRNANSEKVYLFLISGSSLVPAQLLLHVHVHVDKVEPRALALRDCFSFRDGLLLCFCLLGFEMDSPVHGVSQRCLVCCLEVAAGSVPPRLETRHGAEHSLLPRVFARCKVAAVEALQSA